ncbi:MULTISPECIES: hypothetical protein [Bacillus amyloliquefaciens group]|uniref:hypothetical protein n=1 Tax=Bacillus amyloliquefaciens group TaxID=1938374 RepID=UPI001918BC48|nr:MULTISPECIES: hypothetical protein [Bacillus amyloliquefaciens group]UQX44883.1 hypothetical protein M5J22_09705 [Bacillus velezensis]UUA78618.1 hypothetical protein NO220_08570 [Bacillus amyloliquefaciens]
MLGTKADMIMPGVWNFEAERKLTDAERKQELDKLITLLDQKIADYQNFRGNAV